MLAALSIILLAALTFALSRYAVHQRALNRQGAAWLAEAGITRALTALAQTGPAASLPHDTLPAPNGGIISYRTLAWGPQALVVAEGRIGSQQVRRVALVGSWMPEAVAPAITIGDETLPLTVTGSTVITGDVITGLPGVVEGRLNGIGVVHPDFLRGRNIIQPQIALPRVDAAMLRRYLVQLSRDREQPDVIWPGSRLLRYSKELPSEGAVIYVENNLIIDGLTGWLTGQVRTIVVGGSIDITGATRIKGPVQFAAERNIRVGGGAGVDGALLYAGDSVVFTDSCTFSGTAVSPHLIATRRTAALRFPSVLAVYHGGDDPEDTAMVILAATHPAEATLCAVRLDSASSLGQTTAYIDTAAVLQGCVLSEGVTDLRGTVHGCVLTEQFVRDVSPTTYINWLCDCCIDRSRLTYQPAIPAVADSGGMRSPRILWESGYD